MSIAPEPSSREDLEGSRRQSLLIDPGNQFGRPGEYGLFFAIPTWWRGFLFHVLTAPEFMAYSYICSQSDQDAIAFPTGDHFKNDTGRASNTTIYGLLDSCVEKGFLLKETRAPLRRSKVQRNVYQRPSVEHTITRLLDRGLIDGDLRPYRTKLKTKPDAEDFKRHRRAIEHALSKILAKDDYYAWLLAQGRERAKLLRAGLQNSLERRRKSAIDAMRKSSESMRSHSHKAQQKDSDFDATGSEHSKGAEIPSYPGSS